MIRPNVSINQDSSIIDSISDNNIIKEKNNDNTFSNKSYTSKQDKKIVYMFPQETESNDDDLIFGDLTINKAETKKGN